MRRLLLVAVMFGTASAAQAADLPDLRGSFFGGQNTATRNWDGWYVGGQVGYMTSEMDFSHATKSMTSFMLRNSVLDDPTSQWAVLSKTNTQATGFGAFVGRNYQWDDLVFGIEANYTYMDKLTGSSTDSIGRLIVNPAGENPPPGHTHTYDTTLSASAAAQIKDAMTFRGRAGWAAGNFLPYAFAGLAVGRVEVSRTATVSFNKFDDYDVTTTAIVGGTPVSTTVHHTDFLGPGTQTQSQHRTNFVPGWTAGLGFEYMMWGNLFMRAEWEYIKYLGIQDIAFNSNSARFGVGYKF